MVGIGNCCTNKHAKTSFAKLAAEPTDKHEQKVLDVFQSVKEIEQPKFTEIDIGKKIPKDINGKVKYTNSMTPLQKKRAFFITLTVLAIIATLGAIVGGGSALVALFSLLVGMAVALCTGVGALSTYDKPDLDSPKQRRKETEAIQTNKLSLPQVANRYKDPKEIANYALLGDAPKETYQKVVHLAKQRQKAEIIYDAENEKINTNIKCKNRTITNRKCGDGGAGKCGICASLVNKAWAKLYQDYHATTEPLDEQFNDLCKEMSLPGQSSSSGAEEASH